MTLKTPVRIAIMYLMLCQADLAEAQKQGNIWYFGIEAGLDFNGSVPTALLDGQTYTPLPNLWNEGTSTICDSSGMLLFYSNGEKIWNRQQLVMLNGDSLMGHASSTHAALIVPRPGSDRFFHVFTTDGFENDFNNGLRYSIVDLCLDNGQGGVVPHEKNILLAPDMAEKLAAVRHANGSDYWIVAHKFQSNAFLAYHLTSAGIVDTIQSNTGPVDVLGGGGQMAVSTDGTQLAYAYASVLGSLSLFDFDSATGVVSNARTHQNQIDDQSYGVGFSPNGTKLYVTTINWGKVFQYDLSLGSWATIVAGRTLLAAENPDSWRDVKLGPDGKVYISRSQHDHLARIEAPDLAGVACQYVDQAVSLGGRLASFGLPTHITGYDYSNAVSDCSLEVSPESLDGSTFTAWYIGQGQVSIDRSDLGPVAITVFDATGRLCRSFDILNAAEATVDIGKIPNGTYFILARTNSGASHASFVVCDR